MKNLKIVNAEFMTSAQRLDDSPSPDKAEIAFIGRSNVGKSSLLNSLTKRKSLAKSSSTPGKTQLINYFDITFKDYAEENGLTIMQDLLIYQVLVMQKFQSH